MDRKGDIFQWNWEGWMTVDFADTYSGYFWKIMSGTWNKEYDSECKLFDNFTNMWQANFKEYWISYIL